MNIDLYSRRVDYLRIAVTTRCNLACSFCAPKNYDCCQGLDEELTDDEIISIASAAASVGFKKIRLTGGEPLLRRGIDSLAAQISNIHGIEELTLTTNGSLLENKARTLFAAGIKRININLPSIDPVRYKKITGKDELENVLKGIAAAKLAGIGIKINVVALAHLCEDDVVALAHFAEGHSIKIRFIEYMPLGVDPLVESLSIDTLRGWIKKHRLKAEIIAAMNAPFCKSCNRLRISASGEVFPCLFGSPSHYLAGSLNNDPKQIENILLEAVRCKPAGYADAYTCESYRPLIRNIGG